MPVVASDLVAWCAANNPTADTGTGGGAISTTVQPRLTQFSANALVSVESDGSDTRNVTITGRLASGVIDTEVLALNNTTPVVGAKTFERILRVVAASASGTRTITIKQGSGGTTRALILPNEQETRVKFYDSTSEASTAIRYEKSFLKNQHATLSLLSAVVTLTADPASRIRIGVAATVGDTATITNRKTAPAGITFVDDNVAQNVPGTDLAAGVAIGVWEEQNLPANDPPNKNTYTLQLSGSTV